MRESEITSALSSFAGMPIAEFQADSSPTALASLPSDVENHAWRITTTGLRDQLPFDELFALFLQHVDPTRVRALVIETWQSKENHTRRSEHAIGVLVAAAERLSALRAVFLGDIAQNQREISWIEQSDITPLLLGFPQLEELGVRGGEGLELSAVDHENLRRLSIQTGGLSREVVRAVGASRFPALQTLELCLGSPMYGGDSTADDFAGILSGTGLPALSRLALADAKGADQVAAVVAVAPIVARLEELDLSLGDVGDEGAASLLAGQSLGHLTSLDLNHHYITEVFAERLRAAWPTVEIDLASDGTYVHRGERYIAVAE